MIPPTQIISFEKRAIGQCRLEVVDIFDLVTSILGRRTITFAIYN